MNMLLLEDKLNKMFDVIEEANLDYDNLYIEAMGDDDYVYALEQINIYDGVGTRFSANGLTKAVFIDKSSAYVLKMPIVGQIEYDWIEYDDDDEDDRWCDGEYDYDNPYYVDYENAHSEDGKNYCEDELKKYELAVEEGFGEFFPETSFFANTKSGVPIYIQERVRPWDWWSDENKISNDSKSMAKNMTTGLPCYFLAACIDFYGLERTLEFTNWLDSHKEYTSDLHSGNLGTKMNGAPVILDFSGFRH